MKLEGEEARVLAADKLTRLLVDPTHGQSIHLDTAEGDLWRMTYPGSGARDGGSPDLETVSREELAGCLKASREWRCDNLDAVVSFLIDSWCERRAVSPLRFLLPGWPHNGLTDGFAELREALDLVRALARDELTRLDEELVGIAINAIDRALISR